MENQELSWSWSNNRIPKYPPSAASGYKCSSKQIVRKIGFVMTDSTAHNHNKVIEKVKKISYENCFSSH